MSTAQRATPTFPRSLLWRRLHPERPGTFSQRLWRALDAFVARCKFSDTDALKEFTRVIRAVELYLVTQGREEVTVGLETRGFELRVDSRPLWGISPSHSCEELFQKISAVYNALALTVEAHGSAAVVVAVGSPYETGRMTRSTGILFTARRNADGTGCCPTLGLSEFLAPAAAMRAKRSRVDAAEPAKFARTK